MDFNRILAIEDAFCELEAVSQATYLDVGNHKGVDFSEYPAMYVELERGQAFYVFLATDAIWFALASPEEIAQKYDVAVDYYRENRKEVVNG